MVSVGGWGGERKGKHLDVDILLGIGGIPVGEEPFSEKKPGGRWGERKGTREGDTDQRCGGAALHLPGTSSADWLSHPNEASHPL